MVKRRGIAMRFQPINPWTAKGLIVTRRMLPHFEVPNATYFVTLRCRREVTLEASGRDAVFAAIQMCDGVSLDLDAAVVMPTHADAIFRIVGAHKLSHVVQRIKIRSARQIDRQRKHEGALWVEESYDHIIRD